MWLCLSRIRLENKQKSVRITPRLTGWHKTCKLFVHSLSFYAVTFRSKSPRKNPTWFILHILYTSSHCGWKMRLTICGNCDEIFRMPVMFVEMSAVCCVCWSNVDHVLVKRTFLVSVFAGGCVDCFVWIGVRTGEFHPQYETLGSGSVFQKLLRANT